MIHYFILRAPPMPPTPYIKIQKIVMFLYLCLCRSFSIFYDVPEAREVIKNLAEARGFVVLRYRPVASRGDLIQAQNHNMSTFLTRQAKCN